MVDSLVNFSDLENHPAAAFIEALQIRNIVSGFPDGTFRPNQFMTRAEFAAILLKAFPQPKVRNYLPFVDISESFWAASAIKKAYESRFLSGFPLQRFHPQENVTRVQVLVGLVAGLNLGIWTGVEAGTLALESFYQDANQIPNYAREAITIATFNQLVVNFSNRQSLQPNQGASRADVSAFIYQALVALGKAPPIESTAIVKLPTPRITAQGNQISLNGKIISGQWLQWSYGGLPRTGLIDGIVGQFWGLELLSSSEVGKQLGRWFSEPNNPYSLLTFYDKSLRYLDVTPIFKSHNVVVEVKDKTLKLITLPTAIEAVNFEEVNKVSRVTIQLNRPTPVQVYQQNNEWIATVEARASESILEPYKPQPAAPITTPTPKPAGDKNEGETGATKELPKPPTATSNNQQVIFKSNIPEGYGLKFFTVTNPFRLIIELRTDFLVEQEINWLSSLRWQQKYLRLNTDRVPVYYLTVSLKDPKLMLRPIWTEPNSMLGTSSLLQMAEKWQALAAINGGFFNRNTVMPLGVICYNGRWFAGPNFNRGVIAWNDEGAVKISRLTLQETVTTSKGQKTELIALNSGYVKAGISRYTAEWGTDYVPALDDEMIIAIVDNVVKNQIPGGTGSIKKPIPIPQGGYLLTLRAFASAVEQFKVGTQVTLESVTVPPDLKDYPFILGAGPVLLQGGKVALDAPVEQFNDAYIKQMAIRSCLGVTANNELMMVAIHNRVGGKGVNFAEAAQLMQQLGAVSALNLDGGSSTSLYLGGRLINRLPETAARVHNGLGVFLK